MADNYDLVPDLGKLLDAALRAERDGTVYAERIADRLGLDSWAGPEAAERALREALGAPAPRAPDEDQPLTCVRCWNSPASRLLVVHWRTETMRLLCEGCAPADAADARDLPAFRMLTVLTLGAEAVARAGAPGQAAEAIPRTPRCDGCNGYCGTCEASVRDEGGPL